MVGLALLLVAVFAAIVAIEVPPLVRRRQWGELAAFSFLLALDLVVSLLMIFRIEVPNPGKAIEAIFRPIGELIVGK